MAKSKFVEKIKEALNKCECLQDCNIYSNGKVENFGPIDIDWDATNKLEEELGDEAHIVYKKQNVFTKNVDTDPIGEGDIQLIYDGGYLCSVMNCEFGDSTYNKLMILFDNICEKYGYSYEHYSNWETVFYKN